MDNTHLNANKAAVIANAQVLTNAVELGTHVLSEVIGGNFSTDILNDMGREQLGMSILSNLRRSIQSGS